MTHLSREELLRWWQEGPSGERERIVGHLAVCDECGSLYGEVIDSQPLPAAAPAARPDLAARAYRLYRRPPRAFRSLWAAPSFAIAGVAALLAVALGVVLLRSPRPLDGIRGTSLQPLSPIGAVSPPVEFRWESPVAAARYRVEVEDGERRTLFVLFSEKEAVALPPERQRDLTPGEEYWWEVVALGRDGEEVMRAPRRAFSVPRPP